MNQWKDLMMLSQLLLQFVYFSPFASSTLLLLMLLLMNGWLQVVLSHPITKWVDTTSKPETTTQLAEIFVPEEKEGILVMIMNQTAKGNKR
jgi:hypothetical protein